MTTAPMIPLQAVPLAAVVLDQYGHILEANERFVALCRRSRRDLAMTSFSDLMATEYGDVARSRLERLFSTVGADADEFRVRMSAPHERWVNLTATRLGTPPPTSAVLVVLEAIGRARGQFERAMLRLGVRRRSAPGDSSSAGPQHPGAPPLEDIVAAASHELRQPLQAILGWVRIARTAGSGPELLTRAIASIERNALFVNRIADDLLACTPYVRRAVRALEPVEMCRVIDESLESLRPAAQAGSVILKAKKPDGPIVVRGDRAGLHHVMMNLLANAIRATPAQGAVSVLLEAEGNSARVEVSDTGHGIASDQLADLFRPFGQRHDSSRGLGVGLAIVREWVELFDGTIRAESDGEHLGARFIVTLPLDSGH